jgi:hypothetical protein
MGHWYDPQSYRDRVDYHSINDLDILPGAPSQSSCLCGGYGHEPVTALDVLRTGPWEDIPATYLVRRGKLRGSSNSEFCRLCRRQDGRPGDIWVRAGQPPHQIIVCESCCQQTLAE